MHASVQSVNIKNAFSFTVRFISIPEKKKKTLNIEFGVISRPTIKIWDHLNKNCSNY